MTALARHDQLPDFDLPLDEAHLLRQLDGAPGDLAGHYLCHGLERRLTPTPWFQTDWYAWQNPDWVSHAAPYLHYLEKGRFDGRDPSPFVDVPRYRAMTGAAPGAVYDLILAGHRSPALGVYDGTADLEACQARFLQTLEVSVTRMPSAASGRRALVVLQAGRGAEARHWDMRGERNWDLAVNYYDACGYQPDLGDYVFFQKGTKFTAMWMLWKHFRSMLDQYDHVLFLDDDVECEAETLNRLFRACCEHDLDLAQMALCEKSSCNWQALFARPGQAGPRWLTAVEIMMPVLSRKALGLVAPTFGRSISGFGLDLAWGKLVGDAGGRIAVLDDVVATHARPVDQADGAYYSYLRRHMINAKAELWVMLNAYDAERNLTSD